MAEEIYINREQELDSFLNNLSVLKSFESNHLHNLYGPAGIGKSTFIHQLWKLTSELTPSFIWITPPPLAKEWYDNWPIFFTSSLRVNKNEFVPLNKYLNEYLTSPNPHQNEDTHTAFPFEYNNIITKSSLNLTQKWVRMLIKGLAKVHPHFNDSIKKQTIIVFILDDYDQFTEEQKTFLKQNIVDAFNELDNTLDVRYILTTSSPISTNNDLIQYWDFLQNSYIETELKPLSKKQIFPYLGLRQVPSEYNETIFNESAGIPSRLENAINKYAKIKTRNALNQWDNLFSQISEKQKKWLIWAAHLKKITIEGLELFKSPNEIMEAMEWLEKRPELENKANPDGFTLSQNAINHIINWYKNSNWKNDYKDIEGLVATYHSVVKTIPIQEHREHLCLLSIFNFFQIDLISTLFNQKSRGLIRFIEQDTQYLHKGNYRLNIKPEIKNAINLYTQLFPHKLPKDLQARITSLWKAKEADIKTRASSIIKQIEELKKKCEHLDNDTHVINTELRKYDLIIEDLHQNIKHTSNTNSPLTLKNAPQAIIFLMEGIGLLLIYYGILFQETPSILPVLIGIAMLVSGIIWHRDSYQKRKHLTPNKKKNPNSALNNKAIAAKKLLLMRRDEIDKKKKFELHNLSKQKSDLTDIEANLTEPYI